MYVKYYTVLYYFKMFKDIIRDNTRNFIFYMSTILETVFNFFINF